MKTRVKMFAIAFAIILFVSAVPRVEAQTAGTGALTGTVSDSSGAAIPSATVTLTNNETRQERVSTTGSDGVYRFALIPPGNYRVRFSAAGFKPAEVAAIIVNVTETPVLDRRLEVGGQSEQVTVEANVEAVQTATSTLGTVIESNMTTAIPLTTRNYTNLLGLSAGAVASVANASGFGKGGMEIAVNGNRTAQNSFSMDGVNVTGTGSGGVTQGLYATLAIPNPDTIQEFKIQTSLYDAGYGRNPGANVNVITKSGTNAVHGTAFEFFRNTALNATDFFRNRTCGQAPTSPACAGGVKQVLNQNQFGGTLGGPIKKDKLFVFGSYQQTWQKNGASQQGFSSGITLFPIPVGNRGVTSLAGTNDATAAAFQRALGAAFCNSPTNPGAAGAGQGMQVACDGANISPYAMRILQIHNADGSYHIPSSGTSTPLAGVAYSIPAYAKEYQGMLNLDYIASAKHTISSRYFRSVEPQQLNFQAANTLPGLPANTEYGYQNGVLKLTSIVTNSLVNELRGSIIRTVNLQTINPDPSACANRIWPNVGSVGGLLGGYSCVVPEMPFIGAFTAFQGSNDLLQHVTNLGFGDQVSWSKGKHNLRVGGEFEAVRWNWVGSWITHGMMQFQTFSDFLVGLPGACGTAVAPGVESTRPLGCNGSNFSNVLGSSQRTVLAGPGGIVHAFQQKNAALFVQDDWKVNPRLTLNMGMRWEYDGHLSDKYGNLTTMLPSALATVPRPEVTQLRPVVGPYSPAGQTWAGWVVPSNYDEKTWGPISQYPGIIRSGHDIGPGNDVPLNNFAPRLGFAWQPLNTNRLVLRGGAGFFFDRVPGHTLVMGVIQNPPYAISIQQGPNTNQFSSFAVPFLQTSLGKFDSRWVNFNPAASATQQSSNLAALALADNFSTPLVYAWNLSTQYEFLPRWVLEVGYVGSHGIHLAQNRHLLNSAYLATASSPVNGLTTSTIQNVNLRVPYLGMAPAGLAVGDTVSYMRYNSLQVTLRKQVSYGLTFQASYTFGRAFTTQSGTFESPSYNDPRDLRQQYGLNSQYRPHRVVINYNWDIPAGNLRGIARAVLGGWNLAGVTTIQSGQWLTLTDSRGGQIFGLSSNNQATSRAQMAPGATYTDLVTTGELGSRLGGASGGPGYLNGKALAAVPFAVAPDGTVTNGTGWGNSGVGVIEGPGQFDFDTSIAKNTRVGGLHEDAMLQFRAEFFNVFNHPQFDNPALNFGAGNFGQITNTTVNPRIVQLALKYIF